MENLILSGLTIPELRDLIREEATKAFETFQANQAPANQKTIFNFKEGCQYLGVSTSHL